MCPFFLETLSKRIQLTHLTRKQICVDGFEKEMEMSLSAPVDSGFQKRLEETQDLPVLPQLYAQALRIASDPEGDIVRLQEILQHDPSLTAHILKVANSAYYGFPNRIESLRTAIVMLGTLEIIRLLTAASALAAFPRQHLSSDFDPIHFWYHSAAVGESSAYIRRKLNLQLAGDVYTGGLLHDIGKILLAARFQVEYDLCLRYARQQDVPLRVAEQRVLGLDHASIGGLLALRWDLPVALVAMITNHITPERETYHPVEVGLVHLGNRIAKRFSAYSADKDVDHPLEEDPAWQVVAGQKWPDEIDVPAMIEECKVEVERSAELMRSLLSD